MACCNNDQNSFPLYVCTPHHHHASLQMGVLDMAGIPSSAEGGFFDPFGLSKDKDEETINWYRSAELKHGRISMLATLGIFIQGFNTKIIPGFPVTETNEIEALKKVYYEAPSALVQVGELL